MAEWSRSKSGLAAVRQCSTSFAGRQYRESTGKEELKQAEDYAEDWYRLWRLEQAKEKKGKLPARSTLHQENVVLRQAFKTALRHGWLSHLPDLTEPYRKNEKISHRAWFSPEEYRRLIEATRRRAAEHARRRVSL